jgi:hypothetical protein
MRTRAVLAGVLVVCLLVPTGVVAIEGQPNLSATLPENRVSPGEETELRLQITNVGSLEESGDSPQIEQRLTTARGVRAELQTGDGPITVETSTASLGSIADGGVATMPVRVSVAEDAEPGSYRLRVRLRYEYTEEIADHDGEHEEVTKTRYAFVRVVVEPEARFRLVESATDTPVGERGNVTLTLRNVGSATARDARVSVQSRSAEFRVGTNGSVSRFVGAWRPGEEATVDVPATALSTAGRRNYTVVGRVSYSDEDGHARRSEPLVTGVVPAPEQRFAVRESSATLFVGERGTVRGTVVNRGPETARNAVVHIGSESEGVVALQSSYPVGTLEAGESAAVEFPVRVTDRGEPGPHQFDLTVRYRGREDATRHSDALFVRSTVEPERDRFALEPQNATFGPDTTNRLVVRVTNTGDATRTDVTVALEPRPPFTSVAPTAYVGELAPDESERVAFELSVDEDAVESTHPVTVNVTSESPDGDVDGESHRVPVAVSFEEQSVDTSALAAVGVLALLIVAGLGYWWYRRR